MRFGFGGHIEGAESMDPQPKLESAEIDVVVKNAAE
jgi:hypothetical protein